MASMEVVQLWRIHHNHHHHHTLGLRRMSLRLLSHSRRFPFPLYFLVCTCSLWLNVCFQGSTFVLVYEPGDILPSR